MRSAIHALTAATVLVALTVAAAPAARATSDVHEPSVGECHDYKLSAVDHLAEKTKPVPCDQRHTAVTIKVVELPKRIPLADSALVFKAIGVTCYHAMWKTLGGNITSRDLSAYDYAYFEPTLPEQADGAHWVRCDLILYGGHSLAPLPTPLLTKLPLDDSVARCLRRSATGVTPTICAHPHQYRSVAVVKLKGAYKSDRGFLLLAAKRCPKLAGHGFYASWPNATAWKAGDRRLTCSRATAR